MRFVFLFRNDVSPVQILVPGAGLGRLSWEFARLGYTCQGNEVSLYMLIASHFVLNKSINILFISSKMFSLFSIDVPKLIVKQSIRGFSVSVTTYRMKIKCVLCAFQMSVLLRYLPTLDSVCRQEIFLKFTMIQVRSILRNDHRLSMLVLDDWDCVATCFFIDTAHNIIEYVERLWKILKPGGVWINFGSYLII